jgi:hypothetical protein
MVMNVKARPMKISRSHREIVLPLVVRPILRPRQTVARIIAQSKPQSKLLSQPRSQKIPAQKIIHQQPAIVRPKRQSVQNQSPKAKKPIVRIITRDPPESSIKKTRELHNSCIGRILIIVANGPSVLEANLTRLLNIPNIDIMSINKPDARLWPTKYWLFCDISQIKRHRDLWSGYDGRIFNSTMITEARPGTVFIKNIPGQGFSLDLIKGFHIGRSSVYAAMQIATWLGYDKIYIFGCDMGVVTIDGKDMLHFYGQNPDVTADSRKRRFTDEAKYYENAANTLPEDIRKKFYFCSSYNKFGFVNMFNTLDHKQAVDIILDSVSI